MICLNRRYFFGVLLIFFAVDLSPQLGAAQTSSPLVLQGGTLIDATGRLPIEDAVIVVEGNRIKSVGKRGDAQREGTNLGKIRGPRIWSTGSRLVGPPPAWALRGERGYLIKTPEEARQVVRKKKEAGIEIIKFNEYVSPEAIKAGAEEAHRLGLPITCHCLDCFWQPKPVLPGSSITGRRA